MIYKNSPLCCQLLDLTSVKFHIFSRYKFSMFHIKDNEHILSIKLSRSYKISILFLIKHFIATIYLRWNIPVCVVPSRVCQVMVNGAAIMYICRFKQSKYSCFKHNLLPNLLRIDSIGNFKMYLQQ